MMVGDILMMLVEIQRKHHLTDEEFKNLNVALDVKYGWRKLDYRLEVGSTTPPSLTIWTRNESSGDPF